MVNMMSLTDERHTESILDFSLLNGPLLELVWAIL